jgi:hypothetical protein
LNKGTEPNETHDPYAPPASDFDGGLDESWQGAGDAGFGAQTLLVQALTGLLGLQALLQGLNAAACLLLAAGWVGVGHALDLVSISHVLVRAYPVAYYVGAIPFVLFLVGANKNARAFAAADADADTDAEPEPWGDDPELWGDRPERPRPEARHASAWAIWSFSPASMFWWFCVPFLNFVRPYQAVKAVWACSAPEHGGLRAARTEVLSTWWTTWLVSLFAARSSASLKAFDLGPAQRDVIIAVVSLLGVASCVFALRMVFALHQRQRQRAAELWAES